MVTIASLFPSASTSNLTNTLLNFQETAQMEEKRYLEKLKEESLTPVKGCVLTG